MDICILAVRPLVVEMWTIQAFLVPKWPKDPDCMGQMVHILMSFWDVGKVPMLFLICFWLQWGMWKLAGLIFPFWGPDGLISVFRSHWGALCICGRSWQVTQNSPLIESQRILLLASQLTHGLKIWLLGSCSVSFVGSLWLLSEKWPDETVTALTLTLLVNIILSSLLVLDFLEWTRHCGHGGLWRSRLKNGPLVDHSVNKILLGMLQ